MTREQADKIAKGCKRFEYDESGLGKLSMYGYNCTTCTHNRNCKKLKGATDGTKH